MRASLAGLDRRRLRLALTVFFLALAIPAAILAYKAYSQLKWETFHQHQVLAEELAGRIDSHVRRLMDAEQARSFSDYAFLVVAGDPSANLVQRSPLSSYPVDVPIPGLLGYFQVDSQGVFSTPLLPAAGTPAGAFGIAAGELGKRQALAGRIREILGENRLVAASLDGAAAVVGALDEAAGRKDEIREKKHAELLAEAEVAEGDVMLPSREAVPAQAAFDRLQQAPLRSERRAKTKALSRFGRVEDLKLDRRYQADAPPVQAPAAAPAGAGLAKRRVRKEQSIMPELQQEAALSRALPAAPAVMPRAEVRIRTFESEIDPFDVSLLGSGHLVLFRKVWRDGERYVQGALIEPKPFLRGVVEAGFRDTALSRMSKLVVAYGGDVLEAYTGEQSRRYVSSAEELRGELLYQARLSAPFSDLGLLFSIERLPVGPGGTVITGVAAVLVVVLCGGFYLMYRLGVGQIALARQQQDFVSAVSHELKTPLTSIRMYGEILREGWASEEKKRGYYDYIFEESERLSRLIANVLQLARMTRNDLHLDLVPTTAAERLATVESKIASQVERAGFELHMACQGDAADKSLRLDADAFTQILINLVDNAIKFSSKAEVKRIDIGCRIERGQSVVVAVRDFGPGIPKGQMKKIFQLFYRSENELTRETLGTGIGLALVAQLTSAMSGRVDVVNREPGAEFRVYFPMV